VEQLLEIILTFCTVKVDDVEVAPAPLEAELPAPLLGLAPDDPLASLPIMRT
jgi:hypothetical protein